MTDKSVKVKLDLATRLKGTATASNGGFSSVETLKKFLNSDVKSDKNVSEALASLAQNLEQVQADVKNFFGDEIADSDDESAESVNINITISGGKVIVR